MNTTVLVLFAMLGVAAQAGADTIYSYVGHTYTDIADVPLPAGSFDSSMRVSGEFTLADPLAPGLASTDITPLLTSFSFSNGRTTLTNLDPQLTIAAFSVSTDAFGAINLWAISIQQLDAVNGGNDLVIQTLNDPDFGFPVEDSGQVLACDPRFLPRGLCLTLADIASVSEAPGAWTGTSTTGSTTGEPVPEPTTLGLCALGLWAVGRRRAR
jgi:hypothetical protein